MRLAYGKTIHCFQGQSAGPTPPDRPQNAIQRIICDIGPKSFEGQNPGLFYTLLSRATTLGLDNRMNSAVYFTGTDFDRERLMNLTRTTRGQLYKGVELREAWVKRLNKNTKKCSLTQAKIIQLTDWAMHTKISTTDLQAAIDNVTQTEIDIGW